MERGKQSTVTHSLTPQREEITLGEYLWAMKWVLVLLALVSLPYLAAFLFPPPGLVFLGSFGNPEDTSAYLSAMREGARGGWLRHYPFTTEPHEPALYFLFYIVLGKLFGPSITVFHGARLVCTTLLAFITYRLAAFFFPDLLARRTAFLLALFSGGVGWLLVPLGLADRLIPPLDIRWPEATTFLATFISPHFTLGIALELATFLLFLLSFQATPPWKGSLYTLLAALAHLGLSLVFPFSVVTVSLVLLAYSLLLLGRRRGDALLALRRSCLVIAPVVPISLYYLLLFNSFPFWEKAFQTMAPDPSPSPLALPFAYGLVGLLAIAGLLYLCKKEPSSLGLFLPSWAGLNLPLLYLPVKHQGRFAEGWHVALSFLAAAGLCYWLLPRLRGSPSLGRLDAQITTWRNVLIILTTPTTLLVSLLGLRILATEHHFPYFLPQEEVKAVAWLAKRVDFQDVVLASYPVGNYTPAHADCRVFFGYRYETLEWERKRDLLIEFYDTETDDDFRRKLISEEGITYLYHGPEERRLGGFDPADAPYLRPIYAKDGVRIYQVVE